MDVNQLRVQKKTFNRQYGMTFIEVLVALVILTVGILGAVGMQAIATKSSFDAMQRSLASSLAQDMIERMRSNDSSALASYATFSTGATTETYGDNLDAIPTLRCNVAGSLCTPAQMVVNDKYEFELALMGGDVLNNTTHAGGLVGARACISHTDNAVTIIVSWQGKTEVSMATKDATCGASVGVNKKRRQVLVKAFIY